MNERIRSFVRGSLFGLIENNTEREYKVSEILKQTETIKGMSDLQKIILGLLSDVQKEKGQVVAVSKKTAIFMAEQKLHENRKN